MDNYFRKIKAIAENIRLNGFQDEDIKQLQLREIEDTCIVALQVIAQIKEERN